MKPLEAIREYCELCEGASTIEEVAALLYAFANKLDVRYASYFCVVGCADGQTPVKFANYPAEFMRHYYKERIDKIDPITRRGCRVNDPFLWNDPAVRAEMTEKQKSALDRAMAIFGVREGYAVPLHASLSVRAACFFSSENASISPDVCQALRWISVCTHERVARLSRLSGDRGRLPRMPAREWACLRLWALGYEDEESAAEMGISVKTVQRHIEQSCKRFGVGKRQQALMRAIAIGQIVAA